MYRTAITVFALATFAGCTTAKPSQQNADRRSSIFGLPVGSPVRGTAELIKRRAEITEGERRYIAERRRRETDRVLYEQRRTLRKEYGATVLSADVGIDWRQRIEFKRPTIDLERLKNEIEKQKEKQAQIERERAEQKADDVRRREELFASGKNCGVCSRRACRCPFEYITRDPIEDAPTRIPVSLPGVLEIRFADSGFEDGRVFRLPPDRVAVRRRSPCKSCSRDGCDGTPDDCRVGTTAPNDYGTPPTPVPDKPTPPRSDRLDDDKKSTSTARPFVDRFAAYFRAPE